MGEKQRLISRVKKIVPDVVWQVSAELPCSRSLLQLQLGGAETEARSGSGGAGGAAPQGGPKKCVVHRRDTRQSPE